MCICTCGFVSGFANWWQYYKTPNICLMTCSMSTLFTYLQVYCRKHYYIFLTIYEKPILRWLIRKTSVGSEEPFWSSFQNLTVVQPDAHLLLGDVADLFLPVKLLWICKVHGRHWSGATRSQCHLWLGCLLDNLQWHNRSVGWGCFFLQNLLHHWYH